MPTYVCNLPTYVRRILPSRLIAVSLSSSLVVSLRPAALPARAIHVPLYSPPVSAGSERAARNRCLQLSLRNILLKGALRAVRKRAGATIFRSRDLGLPYVHIDTRRTLSGFIAPIFEEIAASRCVEDARKRVPQFTHSESCVILEWFVTGRV